MKKLLLITMLMCSIGTLTACRGLMPEPQTTDVSGNIENSVSEKETEDVQGGTSGEVEEQVPAAEQPQILSLQETCKAEYEGINDYEKLLLISEYNYVSFWEGEENHPEMGRALSEVAGMVTRSQEDEADNIISFAQEMFDINSGNFETQVSTLDIQVRRADSVVVSFLSDSYSDYGFIEDFRGMQGSNYDAKTGEQLLLSDVIVDMESVPAIVLKELNSHIWAGDDYSESVVTEYFKNTPEDGFSWTLDYNGVTFYFGDGEISDPGNGGQSATVSFAEYPELFSEKYMNVPDAYMVRLPLDASYFTDLDGDGTLEELHCSGVYNETDRFYSQFGIYTDSDGHFNYEELFAYGFRPYYVKTEDGKHYIYLFCEESESGNRQMMLVVYDVTGGTYERVGDMNIAPAYIPSDMFVLPLDPNHMLLDNYDSGAQDAEVYTVGSDGMPVRK